MTSASIQMRAKGNFIPIQRNSFNTILKRLQITIFMIACTIQVCNAAIKIQSITVTPSTCENNGSVVIIASSTKLNSILLYEITAGPVITPIQNNPVFSSLFPGTYTLRIYDSDFEYTDQPFTITGNYQLPDLMPITKKPSCTGISDGQITGQPVTGKGNKPFVWELTSSTISIKQSSDVFSNLSTGIYRIKMTDACGNYQTRIVQLTSGSTGLAHATDGVPSIYKLDCNSMVLRMQIKLFKETSKNALTFTIRKANGVVITKKVLPIAVDTIHYVPGIYAVVDTITGIDYGDYLSACMKDNCGYELCAIRDSIAPFDFAITFNTTYSLCNTKLTATVLPKSDIGNPYIKTGFKPPISLTLYDLTTNTRVDSTGCNQTYCNLLLKEQTSGNNYRINITDGCGSVFQKIITWPQPLLPPAAIQVSTIPGCMDSTAIAYFTLSNFGSITTIKILSGPDAIGSNKKGYAFSDQVSYPKLFSAGLNNRFSINNMAAGVYTYSVSDTCGNTVNGTFEIIPSNLSNLHYSYSIKKGCIGDNILYFNPISNNTAAIFITDLQTRQQVYARIGSIIADSLISPTPGKYLLQIYYGNAPSSSSPYNAALSNNITDCWVVTDTLTIPAPSSDVFKSSTSILCSGSSYVEIILDSMRGVPPYQYEISNGPQLFPLQNSNIFQLSAYGDYTIRIRDACGNSTARQISVDSSKFAPIVKVGSSCRGNKIILKAISSTFFTYEWKKPDGTSYTGDSLLINALGPADTGTYTVTKKVKINNCADSFTSSYHLELRDVFTQSVSFCAGTTIQIGTHNYKTSGIYTDTLKNAAGCDSILLSTLYMIPQKIDTNNVRICYGENIIVGSHTYSIPGIYKDSIQNTNGCYDVTLTQLDVNGFPDTAKVITCQGKTIHQGNHLYTSSGIYTDTLVSSKGCDSIITLDLTVLPLKFNTIHQTLCEGASIRFGTHTYNQTGTYIDTLSTITCDSIVTLNLTVNPYIRNAISRTICFGESVFVGVNTYNQPGIYSDTLHTASCDSIVTLTLTVKGLPSISLGKDTSLCFGQSLLLNAGDGLSAYYWNGDVVSSSHYFTVNTVGTFWVKVENAFGCTLTDTIHILSIHPLPVAYAGNDTTLCYGNSIQLTASGGIHYLWTPENSSNATIEVSPESTTNYHVVVSDAHQCSASDDVQVIVYPKSPPLFPQTSFVYCFDANNALTLTANWGKAFLWQPSGETTQSTQVLKAGTYMLTATDVNSCMYSEQVLVTEFCETELYVPSAFSPNGDLLNDSMEVFGKHVTAFKITIFNRWGEIIFISTDETIQWDGTYKGEQMPIGTYPWTITYENIFDNTHTRKIMNGSVTLVR